MLVRSLLLAAGLLCISNLAHARTDSTADARKWCEKHTGDHLKNEGYTPFNWTSSTHLENNFYITDGEWRVDLETIKMRCSVRKGAKASTGRYEILNREVLDKLSPARLSRSGPVERTR